MYVVFFLPLVLSIVAAVMVVLDDYGPFVKGTVVVLVAGAAAMQFVPPLRESIHFLVPLFIQLLVGGWWYIASQLD